MVLRHRWQLCVAIVLAAFLITFLITKIIINERLEKVESEKVKKVEFDPRVTPFFSEWTECMKQNVSKFIEDPDETWRSFYRAVLTCEQLPVIKDLRIQDFPNMDETKRSTLPKSNEPSVMISLGIGHDTVAEESIRTQLPHGSRFYGADPVQGENEEKYTKFGKYFPFAIGAESGVRGASVLKNGTDLMAYGRKIVVHIDFVYFLKEILKESFIDDIWVDNEYAEYAMFPYFYKGGKLDQHNITICQFNCEVHNPEKDMRLKEMFRLFVKRIIDDGRYGIFRPVKGGHYRLYFLNFENHKCREKYIL